MQTLVYRASCQNLKPLLIQIKIDIKAIINARGTELITIKNNIRLHGKMIILN